MVSLGHTGRRVVLGYTLNTLQHVITKRLNVLSKFMILCWATFKAILGCIWPVGHGLDTPARDHLSQMARVGGGVTMIDSLMELGRSGCKGKLAN